MNLQRPYRPELLLLLTGLLARLAFALLPFTSLLALLEDDAWMVTAIARNWALGLGITADGINPTNGFHPLYPLTLGALPYLVAPANLDGGFRANLVICAVLATLALLPLYGLLRHLAPRPIALAGLAVSALNPLAIRVTVNAMETALALLLLLVLWWLALTRPPQTWRTATLLGVVAALAILARLDNAVAAGFVGLAILWDELRTRTLPRRTLAYGSTIAILMIPYIVRNLLVFGAIGPSSGRALSYLHSYAESFAFTSLLQLVAYQTALDLTWAPAWLLWLGLALLIWLSATTDATRRNQLVPALLYVVALTFYYAYLQQQGRERYYVAIGVVITMVVCAYFGGRQRKVPTAGENPTTRTDRENLHSTPWRAGASALGIILLNTALFAQYYTTALHDPGLTQPAMYTAARWIASNLPPAAPIGAQNSGIFQYYSERMVLNLDGKLNHEMVPILEQRALDRYMHTKGIRYLVDAPQIERYLAFYSASLADAPAHRELSSLGKLGTYTRMIAQRLRLGPPVILDSGPFDPATPIHMLRPFTAVATPVQSFPLPNDPSRAVVVYRLADTFGAAQ